MIYLWFLWKIFSRVAFWLAFLSLELLEFLQNLFSEIILFIDRVARLECSKTFDKIEGLAAAWKCWNVQIASGISDKEHGLIFVQELPSAIRLHPIVEIQIYSISYSISLRVKDYAIGYTGRTIVASINQ